MAGAGAVLGVDVGGTGTKARLTDTDGLVLDETRVPTPSGSSRRVSSTRPPAPSSSR
jgi:predicted NBD/HSP70 family sugar kinase